MCGLFGIFEAGRSFPHDLAEAMEQDLYHRGPDGGGIASDVGWTLGFRRLAILDPTAASDQPMTDPSGQCTLVFNGEIYNYRALRHELSQRGVNFRTDGDTEAILEGYLAWGDAVFEKLEGMFALCLVDRKRNLAIAARDPLGIKPLYILRSGKLTGLASEMRPLHRLKAPEIDPAAISELAMFGWAAGTMSNYKGIEKVPGGTIVELDLASDQLKQRRFRDVLSTLKPDGSVGIDEVENALELSVQDHTVSDVGYTLQLSGGVDSSLVAALAAKQNTGSSLKSFSISLGGHAFDEAPYQDMVKGRYGLDHHTVQVTGKDYAEYLPKAVAHMEGPTPHGGCVLLLMLCTHIRKHSKVVLTGEGADEMFGGYLRYEIWNRLKWQEALAKIIPTRLMPNVRPFKSAKRIDGHDGAAWASIYQDIGFTNSLFPDYVPVPGARETVSARFSDFRDRLFAVDQTSYLESLLVRQDKMSMANSVEARVPFTHWPLLEKVNRLSRDIRVPGNITKPVLKKFAEKHLPKELIYRRKIGLWLPYADWFADPDLAGRFVEDAKANNAPIRGWCDPDQLDCLLAPSAPSHTSRSLQRVVEMDVWLRQATAVPQGPRLY